MDYEILSTGSSGNAIYINGWLLDCGIPYNKAKEYLPKIKFIFIGHVHHDHLLPSTIKKIAYEYPQIKFVVGKYLVQDLLDCNIAPQNIYALDLDKLYLISDCKVKLNYLIHDVPNDCIHIEFPNGKKVLYATDTNSMEHIEAKGYDLYFIEANYETDDEIEQRIKEDKENGVYSHYERVKNTHLSQLKAINWLDKNVGENSKYVFIHQHINKID